MDLSEAGEKHLERQLCERIGSVEGTQRGGCCIRETRAFLLCFVCFVSRKSSQRSSFSIWTLQTPNLSNSTIFGLPPHFLSTIQSYADLSHCAAASSTRTTAFRPPRETFSHLRSVYQTATPYTRNNYTQMTTPCATRPLAPSATTQDKSSDHKLMSTDFSLHSNRLFPPGSL